MKKVVCVKNFDLSLNTYTSYNLTIGKVYEVKKIHFSGMRYKLLNDLGTDGHYNKDLFISLKKFRKQKLIKLNTLFYEKTL